MYWVGLGFVLDSLYFSPRPRARASSGVVIAFTTLFLLCPSRCVWYCRYNRYLVSSWHSILVMIDDTVDMVDNSSSFLLNLQLLKMQFSYPDVLTRGMELFVLQNFHQGLLVLSIVHATV